MKHEGPQLEPLLHRLAECPPEFLNAAAEKKSADVSVVAIVCDLMRPLMAPRPPELEGAALAEIRGRSPAELKLISVVCWLLRDEWFMAQAQLATAMWKLLSSNGWKRLVELVRPEKFISDPDRREELVRSCLAQCGLRPQGETQSQAADRLTTLDSAERDRVLRATAAAERRAREIREAMARKQAQESASRYGE
jgi:hypothetical protein